MPIAFLGGMTGVMYRQFAVTIAISVLISAFVALSLTPALCALLIKPGHKDREIPAAFKLFNLGFEKVTDWYLAGVKFFLNHRKTAIMGFLGVIAAIIALFKIIPGGLVPAEDQGSLLMAYSMPPAASLPRTKAFTDKVSAMVKEDPNVEDVLTINGYNMLSATQNTYSGISFIVLKDWEKVVYGYVTLYICSFVLDQVVNSARQSVQFFIISDKYEEIGKHINVYPHRGVTVISASGFYSGKEQKMLFVLAKKRESSIIFRLIKDIDPHAFVSQSAVIGVYGEGFDKIKVK